MLEEDEKPKGTSRFSKIFQRNSSSSTPPPLQSAQKQQKDESESQLLFDKLHAAHTSGPATTDSTVETGKLLI